MAGSSPDPFDGSPPVRAATWTGADESLSLADAEALRVDTEYKTLRFRKNAIKPPPEDAGWYSTSKRKFKQMQARPLPKAGTVGFYIRRTMRHPATVMFTILITLLALFLLDIVMASTSNVPGPRDAVDGILLFCMAFFTLEIVLASIWEDKYFLGFFFWCDVVGTLSLLPDIYVIAEGLSWESSSSVTVLRAGRAARIATRASRMLRLLRAFRLVRAMRSWAKGNHFDNETTTVAMKLQMVVAKRVIAMVLLIMLVLPLLEVQGPQNTTQKALNVVELLPQASRQEAQQLFVAQSASQLVYVSFFNITAPAGLGTKPDTKEFWANALLQVTSSTGRSEVWLNDTNNVREQALFNVLLTCFIVFLFVGGSWMFQADANKLFLRPIRRMVSSIKRLTAILFDANPNSSSSSLDETLLVEAVIGKISDIFAVRLDEDGVLRKTTRMATPASSWQITVEESPKEVVGLTDEEKKRIRPLDIDDVPALQSLDACLQEPTCTRHLCKFLEKEFSSENLLFLEQATEFRRVMSEAESFGKQIYGFFIDQDAEKQINIDAKMRRDTYKEVSDESKSRHTLFDGAEEQILALLTRDSFPRFLKSPELQTLLHVLAKEKIRNSRKGASGKGLLKDLQVSELQLDVMDPVKEDESGEEKQVEASAAGGGDVEMQPRKRQGSVRVQFVAPEAAHLLPGGRTDSAVALDTPTAESEASSAGGPPSKVFAQPAGE